MVLIPFKRKRVGRRAYTGTGAGDRSCGRRHHQRRLGRGLVTNVGVGVGVPGSGGGSGSEHGTPKQLNGGRTVDSGEGQAGKVKGTVGDLSR